ICLSKKSPITNCVAIPGRPPSLYSGAISPSMNSQSILPASCTSSCLMLMIWSSRARNRSADPVVSCFFGRIAPSDAATESCFSIRGNRENEFASFQGLRRGNLAISSQQSRQKTTLAQWVRNSSRATNYHSAALRPELACNPVLHNIDGHPDHGECCICHELGRYSTRKVEQSLPPTFSFRNSCLRFCRLGVPTDKSRVFAIARSSNARELHRNGDLRQRLATRIGEPDRGL